MLALLKNAWARTPKSAVAAAVLVVLCAAAAIATHSLNIGFGDDYALYLRQARSLLDGDVPRVVGDNAFLVSAKGAETPDFTPTVYPWVTSILMVPFVRLFGHTAFDNLRLAEVFFLCVWVVAFLRLLRTRVPSAAALVITAIVALNTQYLVHTNSVLSEIPYLMLATLLLLLFDRVSARHDPLQLPWSAAWQLGAMGCIVFNTRREGMAIIPALLAWQAVAWWRNGEQPTARPRPTWAAARPYAAFVAGCFVFQVVLPSTLFPGYEGSGLSNSFDHLLNGYREVVGEILGLDALPSVVLFLFISLAVVGAIDRLRNGHDAALIAFVACSSILSASHRIVITRYMMLTVPFLLYLMYQGVVYLLGRRTTRQVFLLTPMLALLVLTLVNTVADIDDVQDQRASNTYRLGPGAPAEDEGFEAVMEHTAAGDVVAFFKGRLMSLVTDRRSVQTMQPEVILAEADYYLQRYDKFEPPDGGFSPFLGVPQFTPEQAADEGLVEVWRNDRWVLWRIP